MIFHPKLTRDGTTHVIFEPLDFISKLAALVPKPRVNLTRYHGVFAPNSKHRALVTLGSRIKGRKPGACNDNQDKSPENCRASMTWAQRLKRVFNIDVELCDQCGDRVKVIACIEDPAVIKKILNHLDKKATTEQKRRPQSRAPPQGDLFNCSPARTRPGCHPFFDMLLIRQGIVQSRSRDLLKKFNSQGILCLLLVEEGKTARLSEFSRDLRGYWAG